MKKTIRLNKTKQLLKLLTCVVLLLFINANAHSQTYKIVGTGVTNCFNNTTVISCPINSTDAFFGQYQGIAPSYQNNGNGTTTDLNTGLMWVKARGVKISWDSTFKMAAQCNVGGYADWRVPTIKELYSLINYNGRSGALPAQCIAYIDTNYFGWTTGPGDTIIGQRTIDAQDWSATEYKGLTMNNDTTIFGVNFVDGRIKGYPKYNPGTSVPQDMYVRFVRGNTAYGVNNFVDNSDSTITDNATGLMWAKYDAGSAMNWQSALAYAQTMNTQNYLGHNDWRVPHAKELQSIVDYTRSPMSSNSASIDPVFNCSSIIDEGGRIDWPYFWSATTHLDNMGGVYVSFGAALGWMHMPPTATYYKCVDVHGAGAQRSDPKAGSLSTYYFGLDSLGGTCYGLGPQGDVIRINNYVRLVRYANSTSGINDINNNYLNIYPNPVKGNLFVQTNLPIKDIEISDITGKLLYATKNKTIDCSMLANGVYIIRVISDKGIIYKKFMKD